MAIIMAFLRHSWWLVLLSYCWWTRSDDVTRTPIVVAAFRASAPSSSLMRRRPPPSRCTSHHDPSILLQSNPLLQHFQTSRNEDTGDDDDDNDDDSDIQWELINKHHLGSWKGIWTTYDYMGDTMLETVASVDCKRQRDDKSDKIDVVHNIVQGAKRSDCATCFDSMEIKSIPIATYTKETLAARRTRLGACGMVVGPSVLRSGAMATELVLRYSDGRVRVIFQHAPVWAKDTEPGVGPPQGLKLFRTLISREAKRATAPTAETEAAQPPETGNPVFYRPVPPFDWHKKWAGTSWTWGPDAGNRGWSIEELEPGDDWHGSSPVEVWNLRLPGGLFVQTPRVITPGEAAALRLAWMPDTETLLRLETGILALQPLYLDDDDDSIAGFAPPSLASYRCDVLQKMGDLEGAPSFVQMSREDDEAVKKGGQQQQENSPQQQTPDTTARPIEQRPVRKSPSDDDNDKDSGLETIQDALQL